MAISSFFMVVLVLSISGYIVAEQTNSWSTYIVHMAKPEIPASFEHHDASLKSASDSAEMLCTYANAIHGFSTQLTPEEAEMLKFQPRVLFVLPEVKYELHTTRTPE